MALSTTRFPDVEKEDQQLSDQQMVEQYWHLLPPNIQAAIDRKGAEYLKHMEMRMGHFAMSLKPAQLLARQKMYRILMDLKSLSEFPKDLEPKEYAKLESDRVSYRGRMLNGGDIMDLLTHSSRYPGIDVLVRPDAGKKLEKSLKNARPHELTKDKNSTRLTLPRGAYNTTMSGIQLYSDYQSEWTGNQHYYDSHYDKKTETYYEAKGCQDCDRGPDLRNCKPLINLPNSEVVAIYGHEPPQVPNSRHEFPAFFQNPNYLPDGEPKGGSSQKVFYEKLSGSLFGD